MTETKRGLDMGRENNEERKRAVFEYVMNVLDEKIREEIRRNFTDDRFETAGALELAIQKFSKLAREAYLDSNRIQELELRREHAVGLDDYDTETFVEDRVLFVIRGLKEVSDALLNGQNIVLNLRYDCSEILSNANTRSRLSGHRTWQTIDIDSFRVTVAPTIRNGKLIVDKILKIEEIGGYYQSEYGHLPEGITERVLRGTDAFDKIVKLFELNPGKPIPFAERTHQHLDAEESISLLIDMDVGIENPDHRTPTTRREILDRTRREMGSNADLTEPIRRDLRKLSSLKNKRPAANRNDWEKTLDYCKKLVNDFTNEENVLPEFTEEMGEFFFSLGEDLAPFYSGFANWISTFCDGKSEIIFQGRDSLGFLVAYTQSKPIRAKWIPGSRWKYSSVTRNTREFNGLKSQGALAELQKLRTEYERCGYLNRSLIFVDFGFKGSNPRKELLLAQYCFGKIPPTHILLAIHDTDATDTVEGYIQNNFSKSERKTYRAINTALRGKTHGYLNTFFPDFYKKIRENNTFHYVFQELSSYVKEAPGLAIEQNQKPDQHKREHLVVPPYELVAKYSFLKGVTSGCKTEKEIPSRETVIDSLERLHDLIEFVPNLFNSMLDVSQRYHTNLAFKSAIDNMNDDLDGLGLRKYMG